MIHFTILLPILIQLKLGNAAEPLHHSSAGSYHTQWKEFGPCSREKRGTDEFLTDVHLTKRRQGVTELVGKYIFQVPFDDNLTINVDFAVFGSNSAWLPNAYNIQIPRACNTMMTFLKGTWTEFLKNMGISPKCPIAKGTYELKGFDMDNMMSENSLLKEFFYGRFKITMEYLRFKKLIGCTYAVVQIIPGWQRGTKKKGN